MPGALDGILVVSVEQAVVVLADGVDYFCQRLVSAAEVV